MFGYCAICDKYRSFDRNGDTLYCPHCGWTTPYDANDSFMIEEAEIQVQGVTVKLQPFVLKVTAAADTLEALEALMSKDITELFRSQIQPAIELAAQWKVSIPAITIIETPNRNFSAARAILIKADGSTEFYKRKLPQVAPLTPPPFNYYEYLKTPEWQNKKQEALKHAGYRCQVCNSPDHLDGHHRTYKNVGHEAEGDITILCRGCHQLFFDYGRLARN